MFGLSMDYEGILFSRKREEYDRTGDNATAVADGLAATAENHHRCRRDHDPRVQRFVRGDDRAIKLFGFTAHVPICTVRVVSSPVFGARVRCASPSCRIECAR